MRRREFIAALGGAVAWPLVARGQQNRVLWKIGVLHPGVLGAERERLIMQGLISELGGERAVLLVRSAEGNSQLLVKFASELVADRVDVILAIASGSLEAARQASQTIPIVAVDLESDPIAAGAAQSLNRPGGNVTGIFFDAPEIAGKWIQIMKEMLPQIGKVALLYDLHLDQTQVQAGENTTRKLGITTLRLGIDQPSEFRAAFQRAVDAKVDAMLVHSSPIFVDQVSVIAELATEFRLPSVGLFPLYAKVGGLVSYGPDNFELLKQSGVIVGKILGGAKPAEFPIQRPVHTQFLINLRTAKLLQLTIPPSLSALANEVIE